MSLTTAGRFGTSLLIMLIN